MATERVRLSGPGRSPAAKTTAATRRKPRQSRAQASSQALQEAFVRLLLERGYERVTIREVAAVAGVGVGTFYEYVANKQALAALTIHLRVKALAQALLDAVEALRGLPQAELVAALLAQQMDAVMADARAWSALFMLERQVSTPEAYRKHYDQYAEIWREALAAASNPPPPDRLASMARMVHAMAYGWLTQSLLTQGPGLDRAALQRELGLAVQGYLTRAASVTDGLAPESAPGEQPAD